MNFAFHFLHYQFPFLDISFPLCLNFLIGHSCLRLILASQYIYHILLVRPIWLTARKLKYQSWRPIKRLFNFSISKMNGFFFYSMAKWKIWSQLFISRLLSSQFVSGLTHKGKINKYKLHYTKKYAIGMVFKFLKNCINNKLKHLF